MNIGILTLPPHLNYGGILQAWALQTILQQMGHTVSVLRLKNNYLDIRYLRLLRYVLMRIFREKEPGMPIDRFVLTRLNLLTVNDIEEIYGLKFDYIVVGSDQIWKKDYFKYLWANKDATLAFLPDINVKKISYAASIGSDEWDFDERETKIIKKSLSDFKGISVRELSTVELLYKHTGIMASWVLDPTLVLSKEYYLKLISKDTKNVKSKTVSYILDPSDESANLLTKLSFKEKNAIVELNHVNVNGEKLSIQSWLKHIANAKIVLTDSFHGCVFSIIFNKPLIFLINSKRGANRFKTLIDIFGIEKNLVSAEQPYNESFSYELPGDIEDKLTKYRDKSLAFLKNSLA